MDVMSLLGLIAGIASIIGAVISVHQALQSKSSAEEAKNARDQLVEHRETSELSHLQAICKKAQNSMFKYGPGTTPSSLKGISPEKDAKDVEEFMLLLRENRSLFGEEVPNEADDICDKLNDLLGELSISQNEEDLKANGSKLLLIINHTTAIIKKLLDTKKEELH